MTITARRYRKGKLYDLDINELRPDPDQPRKYFDKQALSELKNSIAKHGVLQPILARYAPDEGLLVVSGERRYQASLKAGLTNVPVLITDGDPVEISIVENLLREDLTAIEEAEAIDRLKKEHDYKLSDLAAIIGKAQSTLCEILSLNKLPSAVKDDCRNDPRTARHILTEIARESSENKMEKLYQRYKEQGLTRGELRARARLAMPGSPEIDLSFVDAWVKKLTALELEKLEEAQLVQLIRGLKKLRSVAYAKLKVLRQSQQQPSEGGGA